MPLRPFAVALLTGILALGAGSAGADGRSSPPPVTLPGTAQIELTAGPDGGRPYRLLVSEPREEVEPPDDGYPVLFVLDGNAHFAAFHAARRLQKRFAATIIVGVGYPTDKPLDFERRSYDFSPPAPPSRNDPPQGGDDAFLETLSRRIVPAIAEHYPVDRNRLSVFGHSFGGMFALHALFTRPGLFSGYVVASPSLWWQHDYLLDEERRFVARVRAGRVDVRDVSVLLVAGSRETPQTIQDARAQAKRLRPLSAHGLRTAFHLQPGEDHMSLPPAIVTRTLRQVFTARRY